LGERTAPRGTQAPTPTGPQDFVELFVVPAAMDHADLYRASLANGDVSGKPGRVVKTASTLKAHRSLRRLPTKAAVGVWQRNALETRQSKANGTPTVKHSPRDTS